MPFPPARDNMVYAIYLDAESAHRYFQRISGERYAPVYIQTRKPDAHGRIIVEWAAEEPERILRSVLYFMQHHGLPEPIFATFFEVPKMWLQEDIRDRRVIQSEIDKDVDVLW